MAWMLPAALLASSAISGLTGRQRKQKGVQQQFQENVAFLNRDFGASLQNYLASIMAGAQQQGARLGTSLQGQIGRAGAGGTGLGAAARGIARSHAGNQALQARGRAGFEGQMGIYQLAANAAGAAGPSPTPPQSALDTLIANLGSFLVTQGGGQVGGQRGAIGQGGLSAGTNSNFFGYRNLPRSSRLGG